MRLERLEHIIQGLVDHSEDFEWEEEPLESFESDVIWLFFFFNIFAAVLGIDWRAEQRLATTLIKLETLYLRRRRMRNG